MLAQCSADVSHFSGISARKGGLTALTIAITAGVPEEFLYLLPTE